MVRFQGGVWYLHIAAPPVKGKANKELIEFLSDVLGVNKNCLEILRGETSHNKVLAVKGLNPEQVHQKLTAAIEKK